MKTWHYETLVVAGALAATLAATGRISNHVELIGAAAVLLTFCHASVADRLAEFAARSEEQGEATVACHRWARFYWVGKELCWLAYFFLLGAYSALVGVGVFLAYPVWRSVPSALAAWRCGMSLRDVKACMEALQEKIDHLEDGTLHRCCECDEAIKAGDKDAPWCNKCGAPAHCDGCGGDIVQGLCSDCVKGEVEKAAAVELPRCGECDEKIKSHGYCPHCHRQEVSAAKACAITRYPHVGIPRTGAIPDQILSFLVILVDTCGCRSRSRRCSQCDDAQRLHDLYRASMGEVRA